MASTTTDLIRLEKQTAGENENDWGDRVNTVFELIEDAMHGLVEIATTGGDSTLTTVNHSTDQARMAIIKVTGTLVSNAIIIVPALTHKYILWNATTGDYTVTIKVSGGAVATVGRDAKALIMCDATDCFGLSDIPSATVMLFFQSAVPVGWSQVTAHNNVSLRVVSGSGGGTGGTVVFTTAFKSQAVTGNTGSTGLSVANLAAHTHTIGKWTIGGAGGIGDYTNAFGSTKATSSTGSSTGHTHNLTSSVINLAVKYLDLIIGSKD
jgi:hypothetical protein